VATVAVAAVLVLIHVALEFRMLLSSWRRRLLGLALVALPQLMLAGMYGTMIRAASETHREYPKPRPGLNDLLGWSETLYRDFPWFWRAALLVAVAAPVLMFRHRRTPLWTVTTALVLTTPALTIATREFRYTYLLPTACACAVALFIEQARIPRAGPVLTMWTRRALPCALLGIMAIQVGTGISFFVNQVHFYTGLRPGVISGMDWLRSNTSANEVIAVSATERGYPLGWWIEGYAQRPAVYGGDLAYLLYRSERSRDVVATDILSTEPRLTATCATAHQHGIRYLFVENAWAVNKGFFDDVVIPQGAAVIVDNDALFLLRCPR
jgi:hypothetical protein